MFKKHISYDKEFDILFIHQGFADGEDFLTNIDAGDVVFDVSTKGRIRGLELTNATSFLKRFNITAKTLGDIADADLTASFKKDSITAGLLLKLKDSKKKIPAKIIVPGVSVAV